MVSYHNEHTMDAIRVDGLTKEFGTVTAVDDLSFSVEEGEVFGLLGPNGAGKSTLINMLVTLLDSTTGTAVVNGHDIHAETGSVRDSLGIVFQESAVDEELTGEENLAFHARMYGKGKAERDERIPEVLDLVDLAGEGDQSVGEYSGGMKRRLEIGRGLMHEPDVLFLDEPTTGLDARTRHDTWEYIQRLNRESGVTIVITTHYMDEADFLCERVAVMDRGEIVAVDSPEGLKDSLGGDVVTLGLDGAGDDLFARLDEQSWVRERTRTEGGIAVTLEQANTRVVDIVRLADETGTEITTVDLDKPSLEDVFLSLTGSSLTDREADAADENGERDRGDESNRERTPDGERSAERAEAAE